MLSINLKQFVLDHCIFGIWKRVVPHGPGTPHGGQNYKYKWHFSKPTLKEPWHGCYKLRPMQKLMHQMR